MYALYSKNKPQSDALLSSHGNEFFKVRLEALGTSITHRQVPGSTRKQDAKHSQDKNQFKKQMFDVLDVN